MSSSYSTNKITLTIYSFWYQKKRLLQSYLCDHVFLKPLLLVCRGEKWVLSKASLPPWEWWSASWQQKFLSEQVYSATFTLSAVDLPLVRSAQHHVLNTQQRAFQPAAFSTSLLPPPTNHHIYHMFRAQLHSVLLKVTCNSSGVPKAAGTY